MKRIQYHKYGGPETMQLEDFELQSPGPGGVAVKVKFTAINPIDWKVRRGELKMVTGKSFPRAMGSDFSGIVTAVGAGVTRCKPGDAVFGMARLKEGGALGEAVMTSETFIAKKPDSLTFEQAACLATPGVTAWNGLVDKANLQGKKRVFVNGCMGAVGEATVQLARMLAQAFQGAAVRKICAEPASWVSIPYSTTGRPIFRRSPVGSMSCTTPPGRCRSASALVCFAAAVRIWTFIRRRRSFSVHSSTGS